MGDQVRTKAWRARRGTAAMIGLMALLAGASLAGCSGARPAPSPTPTADTAGWPTAQLFHTGRTSATLTVPRGARSLHIDFSCDYGLYAVGPDTSVQHRNGSCGGAQSFDFDVHTVAEGTRLTVELVVPDTARLAATLSYSTRPFTPDAATAKQCAALSAIEEAYWNADQGHERGDVTDAQWTQQTAEARADLLALAARAQQSPAAAGLLGTVIPQLAGWLAGAGDHPGGTLHAPPGDYTAAVSLAGQICDANGTGVVIHSKYGG